MRLLDCINKVGDLIDCCHEIGLKGCAITDHEILSSHLKAQQHLAKRQKENPDDDTWQNFQLLLGNEIYLVRDGMDASNFVGGKDRYYHFILIAKDEIGHKQLRELSTRAWRRSYYRMMRRVPTYYKDIEEIIGTNPGHVVGSTACLGGRLPATILAYGQNSAEKARYQADIMEFIKWGQNNFGADNFFLEMQPSHNEEQIFVNTEIKKMVAALNLNVIITTDAHYLQYEDRIIHKAYLNSKEGDREVDEFYGSTYVMTSEEIHEYMDESLGIDFVDLALNTTVEIGKTCKSYDLKQKVKLPYIPLKMYEGTKEIVTLADDLGLTGILKCLKSEKESDVQLGIRIMNRIQGWGESFIKDPLCSERVRRINEEIDILFLTSDKMELTWSRYLCQMADYVSIFWNEGDTIVGPGRGSGAGFYLNYLLDITQVDPTIEKVKTYSWRLIIGN